MTEKEKFEKLKVRKEKLAAFWYNISQLTFTGTGVGGFLPLLKGEILIGNFSVMFFGVAMTALAAYAANRILKY